MIFIYLFIGIIASVISALPLGASNIAVINTTLKQNARQAIKIAIAAGVAEVILSYYALHCNDAVKSFFYNNLWVQISLAAILLGVGLFLLFKKQPESREKKTKRFTFSKYVTGFVLGLLNPPVLIYWVIMYGVINSSDFMLSLKSSFLVLFLFFTGVYLGKLLTLYFYSKLSVVLSKKLTAITGTINHIVGVLLIAIGVLQYLKIYIM